MPTSTKSTSSELGGPQRVVPVERPADLQCGYRRRRFRLLQALLHNCQCRRAAPGRPVGQQCGEAAAGAAGAFADEHSAYSRWRWRNARAHLLSTTRWAAHAVMCGDREARSRPPRRWEHFQLLHIAISGARQPSSVPYSHGARVRDTLQRPAACGRRQQLLAQCTPATALRSSCPAAGGLAAAAAAAAACGGARVRGRCAPWLLVLGMHTGQLPHGRRSQRPTDAHASAAHADLDQQLQADLERLRQRQAAAGGGSAPQAASPIRQQQQQAASTSSGGDSPLAGLKDAVDKVRCFITTCCCYCCCCCCRCA